MKKRMLFVCIAVMVFFLFRGCAPKETPLTQRLILSAETVEDSYVHIPQEELNGNFDIGISYFGVKNLTIEINGKNLPLESAISDGLITVEEIWAYAMIDARNGFCTEEGHSYNGLSHFIYHYPDVCDLYFSHDVYETPSGNNYTTMHFDVYAYQQADNVYHIPSEYDEYGNSFPVDQEDWKLTIKADHITSSGLDILIYQPYLTTKDRSQHIGQLHLTSFMLLYMGENIPDNAASIQYKRFQFPEDITAIEQDTVNSFSVSASHIEGFPTSLPSGSYQICLTVRDIFDEESVHPLMRDYAQEQQYWIQFDIP